MKYTYTAVLSPIEGSTKYAAKVPDLPGCVTTADNLDDAIEYIEDAAAGWLCVAEDHGVEIAQPTPQKNIHCEPGDILSLIRIDTLAYRAETDTKAVRKTVSLPAWMCSMADKLNLNCSKILQDALKKKLEAI